MKFCLPFCHKWEERTGLLTAFTVGLLRAFNGSKPIAELVTTKVELLNDGSARIYAWRCARCGKQKAMSKDAKGICNGGQ